MFKLSETEWKHLRSQIGISSIYGGRRYPSYAFTEYGITALSGVLNSSIAIKVNIEKLENDSREMKEIFQIVFDKINHLEDRIPFRQKNRKRIGLK